MQARLTMAQDCISLSLCSEAMGVVAFSAPKKVWNVQLHLAIDMFTCYRKHICFRGNNRQPEVSVVRQRAAAEQVGS